MTTMRTLPALLLAVFAGSAAASSFQLLEQNASGIGTAFAGSAAIADNASTNYFNPAGLTQLSGKQVSLGVAAIRASYKFHNNGSSGPFTATGGEGGDAGGLGIVPNAYFSWQLTPDLYLGFGISSPFGLATEYDDQTWMGRAHALTSKVTTINYNPSVAYRVSDKVSLGFGLNYQTIDAEMTSMVPTLLGERKYKVEGDDAAWGWNAGALFTLSPAMRVGVSYRSAVDYTLGGTRSVAGISNSSAKADLKLPDTFILSVWQQVSDRWEAMGDLSYTNWSTVDKLVIRHATGTDTETFGYKDTWRIAWGAAYKVSDPLKFKFGIAYDQTPTRNNTRTARTPDNNRIWFSVGGQWDSRRYGKFDLGYAYLFVKDADIAQTKFAGTPFASTLRGEYRDSAHILGLQYSVGF